MAAGGAWADLNRGKIRGWVSTFHGRCEKARRRNKCSAAFAEEISENRSNARQAINVAAKHPFDVIYFRNATVTCGGTR
jgi:hypothetical protein